MPSTPKSLAKLAQLGAFLRSSKRQRAKTVLLVERSPKLGKVFVPNVRLAPSRGEKQHNAQYVTEQPKRLPPVTVCLSARSVARVVNPTMTVRNVAAKRGPTALSKVLDLPTAQVVCLSNAKNVTLVPFAMNLELQPRRCEFVRVVGRGIRQVQLSITSALCLNTVWEVGIRELATKTVIPALHFAPFACLATKANLRAKVNALCAPSKNLRTVSLPW
mmetsp:Transcript_49564/g.97172  ORF Transcript_49564/g.97172 Transcript_49564/m.97172 type:complete len:218 (+) Transcript_49564:4317-4970(+)